MLLSKICIKLIAINTLFNRYGGNMWIMPRCRKIGTKESINTTSEASKKNSWGRAVYLFKKSTTPMAPSAPTLVQKIIWRNMTGLKPSEGGKSRNKITTFTATLINKALTKTSPIFCIG